MRQMSYLEPQLWGRDALGDDLAPQVALVRMLDQDFSL